MNDFAQNYTKHTMDKPVKTVSFARITDFIIIVTISAIASFIWGYKRSNSIPFSVVVSLLFLLFASVFMYSINIRLVQKKQKKVNRLSNRMYLQTNITNGTNIQFANLLIDMLETKGFYYMPETGSGYRLSKDKEFYLLYPLRRHTNYKVTGQDILFVCDIARRKKFKRVIIASSCEIDPVAVEFAQVVEGVEVLLLDMDNILELFLETYEEVPQKELDKYKKSAEIIINQSIRKRRSLVKLFPAARYLLCGIMLFVAASYMPFNTFYIISGGICMIIFVLILLFPSLRKDTKTSAG